MPAPVAPKIVITGTGRAGTTLLVQILDELGLDTGVAEGKLSPYGHAVRAGLEARVDDPEAPTVVKDMTFGFRAQALLDSGEIAVAHVLIPTRRLDVAVASRIRAAGYGRLPFRRGALTGTLRATDQKAVLEKMRAELIDALHAHEVPYTELEFPRFAGDAAYLHERLAVLHLDATVEDVQQVLDRCVRPELIHEVPLSRREVWRTRAVTAWMVCVRYPVAAVRRRLDPAGQKERLRAAVLEAQRQEALAAEAERRARSAGEER